MKQNSLPRLVLSDGALEALKWTALLLMTGDHVNKYLFNGTKDWLSFSVDDCTNVRSRLR